MHEGISDNSSGYEGRFRDTIRFRLSARRPIARHMKMLIGFVVGFGVGLLPGVDRFLNLCRIVRDVSGKLAAAVVVFSGVEESDVLLEAS